MMDYSPLIEFLRQKQSLTNLENDILDTLNELQKNPFNRHSAELQVKKNNCNYFDIYTAIAALPTTVERSFTKSTDGDIRYNLKHQLEGLVTKELEVLKRGK